MVGTEMEAEVDMDGVEVGCQTGEGASGCGRNNVGFWREGGRI